MLEGSTPRSLLIMYSPPSFRDRKKTFRYTGASFREAARPPEPLMQAAGKGRAA